MEKNMQKEPSRVEQDAERLRTTQTRKHQADMTPSEAVYGVLSWLTVRHFPLILSRFDDASVAAQAAKEFCETQGLAPVRDTWPKNMIPMGAPKPAGTENDTRADYPADDRKDPPIREITAPLVKALRADPDYFNG